MLPRVSALLMLMALLSACATAPAPRPALAPAPPPVAPTPPMPKSGLDRVMGRGITAVTDLFGPPELDVREGNARKLQFRGPFCVLDVYFYPRGGGTGDAAATYLDARTPNGDDLDRASCIAALSRRREAR